MHIITSKHQQLTQMMWWTHCPVNKLSCLPSPTVVTTVNYVSLCLSQIWLSVSHVMLVMIEHLLLVRLRCHIWPASCPDHHAQHVQRPFHLQWTWLHLRERVLTLSRPRRASLVQCSFHVSLPSLPFRAKLISTWNSNGLPAKILIYDWVRPAHPLRASEPGQSCKFAWDRFVIGTT